MKLEQTSTMITRRPISPALLSLAAFISSARIQPANAFLIPITPSRTATQLHEAPVPFAGVGPRSGWADMKPYNIPLDVIAQEWTANLVAKTLDTPEQIVLGAKNARELFVDTIQVPIPRKRDQGLGIELQEIAGGREDGLGITIVTGLVEGGCAEGTEIMPGDSIASISVARRKKKKTSVGGTNLQDIEDIIEVKTECLGYDATVDGILSLPPPQNEEETLMLTMKRIRRKPIVTVNLRYPPSQEEPDAKIELFAGENLRLAMLVRGVKLNDPLAKRFDTKNGGNCGAGGLCRTCAVSVLRGGELISPQKLSEKQMLEDNPRWRLACKAFVGYGMNEGEITVQVNPRQWEV